MASLPPNSRIRFGPFELDLLAGKLLKQGVRVRLQDQPYRVLLTLLSQSGHVVSHETLRGNLWSDGTHVDFDHSLSVAVNKLREALGDSSDQPLYIETIARRGYCFIAPIEIIHRPNQENEGPQSRSAFIVAVVLTFCAMLYWLLDAWQVPPRSAPASGATRNPPKTAAPAR